MKKIHLAILLSIAFSLPAAAATYYVDSARPNDWGDGTSWNTAKKSIQAAINAAADYDVIRVAAGTYAPVNATARSYLTIRSESGADVTAIDGGGSSICAYLGPNSASRERNKVIGFTLKNGYAETYGAALNFGTAEQCVITNCVSGGESAVYDSLLRDCLITGNTNTGGHGGGLNSCDAYSCRIENNKATAVNPAEEFKDGRGGGAAYSFLYDCTISGNEARVGGGIYYCHDVQRCVISDNEAATEGGGSAYSQLIDCLIYGNTALGGGGAINQPPHQTQQGPHYAMINCTIVGNTATGADVGGGIGGGYVTNCIVQGNIATQNPNNNNYKRNAAYYDFHYCSISPVPPESSEGTRRASHNSDADPRFIDPAAHNYRLAAGSPCIDAGAPGAAFSVTDLDGRRRLIGGRVDIGAYEWGTFSLYVAANGSDQNAGTSWSAPKLTLQGAVNAALPYDEIHVGEGTYAPFETDNLRLTIRSTAGRAATIIDAANAARCATLGATLSQTNTTLIGFTLRNGSVTGTRDYGGGVRGGSLKDCIIENCSALFAGGGAAYSDLENCILQSNTCEEFGGGASDCIITQSQLTRNRAQRGGGAHASTLRRSIISFNATRPAAISPIQTQGAGTNIGQAYACFFWLNGSEVPAERTALGGGMHNTRADSCTFYLNRAESGGGAALVTQSLSNSILLGNTSVSGPSCSGPDALIVNSCLDPANNPGVTGIDCIFEDPIFANLGINYRLGYSSPCVGAGNPDFVVFPYDLDGFLFVSDGKMAMGCYARHAAATADGADYGWLETTGLVTPPGSLPSNYEAAALTDPAGKGYPAWQDYIAGTDPFDPASRLTATIEMVEGEAQISWQPDLSPERVYSVWGKTNLTDTVEWGSRDPGHRFFKVSVGLPE